MFDFFLGKRSEKWYREQISHTLARLKSINAIETHGTGLRGEEYWRAREDITIKIETQALILDKLIQEAKGYGYNVDDLIPSGYHPLKGRTVARNLDIYVDRLKGRSKTS